MSNKYNSITETFTSAAILNELLNLFAVPPADMHLTSANFTPKYLFPRSTYGTGPHVKMNIADHPRIVGIGLFCNIADGLVQIDDPADSQNGPTLNFSLHEFDNVNADQGQVGSSVFVKIPELNAIFATDILFDVSGVDITKDSLRMKAEVLSDSMDFSTISVHPSFATRRLIFYPVVVIEHGWATSPE